MAVNKKSCLPVLAFPSLNSSRSTGKRRPYEYEQPIAIKMHRNPQKHTKYEYGLSGRLQLFSDLEFDVN